MDILVFVTGILLLGLGLVSGILYGFGRDWKVSVTGMLYGFAIITVPIVGVEENAW